MKGNAWESHDSPPRPPAPLQESWTQEADLPDLLRAAAVTLQPGMPDLTQWTLGACPGVCLNASVHLGLVTGKLSEAGARFSP